MKKVTYLDWNATSPPHPEVLEAMHKAQRDAWGNAASVHGAGRVARQLLEDAREALARELSVLSRDIIFTGGGTEANHLALSGAQVIVTSKMEHPSIVAQVEAQAAKGARVQWLQPSADGMILPETLEKALEELKGEMPEFFHSALERDPDAGGRSAANTPMVYVMAANHETGVIQATEELAAVCHAFGAHLHVDAVQLFLRADHQALKHADSMTISAHKIRGPKNLGALCFACGWNPLPLGRGGSQERGLRPGTQDAASAAGLLAALARKEDSKRGYENARKLRDELEAWLVSEAAGQVTFHGRNAKRLGHVTNFRIKDWKGDELVATLDLDDICVSSGSACSAGTAEPSEVIKSIYGSPAASGALRISFGETSTRDDLEALKKSLKYHLKLSV